MRKKNKEIQEPPETSSIKIKDIKERWIKRIDRIVIGLIVAWLSGSYFTGPTNRNTDDNTPKNVKTETAKVNKQQDSNILVFDSPVACPHYY